MSKIGKQPVLIPEGVKVEISNQKVVVSGPKGNLERVLPRQVEVKVENGMAMVTKKGNSKTATSLHGTTRAHLFNMVKGVGVGFSRSLELVGTGFRAEVAGRDLSLIVGYSHPVKIVAPDGITLKVEKLTITVEGIDKELVGQLAANIRAVRPPEPYKGKGIKYTEEIVRKKPGKAAAAKTGVAA